MLLHAPYFPYNEYEQYAHFGVFMKLMCAKINETFFQLIYSLCIISSQFSVKQSYSEVQKSYFWMLRTLCAPAVLEVDYLNSTNACNSVVSCGTPKAVPVCNGPFRVLPFWNQVP